LIYQRSEITGQTARPQIGERQTEKYREPQLNGTETSAGISIGKPEL